MTALDWPDAAGRTLSIPRWLVLLAGFTLLTALFFWPWLIHPGAALIGPPEDNMQDLWNSWHVATAQSWRELFFTRQIRWPEGTALTYHSFAWPQVAALALLAKLFGTDFATVVALQNLTLLASFPLAALSMFYLARHLLGPVPHRDLCATVAAFVFAFNPWHVAQVMHHAHVATIQFLPLFVLAWLKALETRDRRWLAAAAALQALNALACWYFFFYALYFMAFHLLYLRIRHHAWPRGWTLAAPLLCNMGAALLLAPWIIPMTLSAMDRAVYYVGGNMFVADLAAWFAFPPTHPLAQWGHGVYSAITGNTWEGTIYLGLANLALLAWALTRKDGQQRLHYALGGLIFFAVIASGETLHVAGHVTPLHLPGNILAKLPFFANVRTPARAAVFVYLFLGLALAEAAMLALRGRPVSRKILAVLPALMLLDFWPTHLAATPVACPAPLAAIANDPEQGFAVLDLPGGYEAGNRAMMLSACHGRPIVMGETARKMGLSLADRLETKNLSAQQAQLRAVRVKYVVLHGAVAGDYRRQYRLAAQDRTLTVLRVW